MFECESELPDEHALRLGEMRLSRLLAGWSASLQDTTWKHQVKTYCDRNGLNYAAALVYLLATV